MPPRTKHVPTHRKQAVKRAVARDLGRRAVSTGAALAVTGIAVSSAVVVQDTAPGKGKSNQVTSASSEVVAAAIEQARGEVVGADRVQEASRSADRGALTSAEPKAAGRQSKGRRKPAERPAVKWPAKATDKQSANVPASARASAKQAVAKPAEKQRVTPAADPRDIARAMMAEFGFAGSEFGCLDALYISESDWDMHADNPTSSAYGIPQAMTTAHDLPADFATNGTTQIRWGLGYIRDSYGTPCAAWGFKQANNWY